MAAVPACGNRVLRKGVERGGSAGHEARERSAPRAGGLNLENGGPTTMTKLFVCAAALLAAGCSTRPEGPRATTGSVVRLDPALDQLVPKDARIEKLAGGFTF